MQTVTPVQIVKAYTILEGSFDDGTPEREALYELLVHVVHDAYKYKDREPDWTLDQIRFCIGGTFEDLKPSRPAHRILQIQDQTMWVADRLWEIASVQPSDKTCACEQSEDSE